MARQPITLHKFDGGMSDDQRIQTTRQLFDNDGFDILDETNMLRPLRDWVYRVDYDAESNIGRSVSENTNVIFAGGTTFYTMTEDGSGNARPVKITNLRNGTLSVTDPTGTTTGTAKGLSAGGEILFLNRLWFVDEDDDLGYYDLDDDTLNYGVYNGSSYNSVTPIVSPDKKSLLFPYQNQINEVSYNPATSAYTFSTAVLRSIDDITAIAQKGNIVMVASHDDNKGSFISSWSVLEEDITQPYYVSEDKVFAMGELESTFVAVTAKPEYIGDYGSQEPYIEFFYFKSSGFEKYRRFAEDLNGNDIKYKKVTIRNNKMYFVGNQYVWVVGSKNSDYPMVVSKLTSLKLDSSKYSGVFEEAEMFSIFSDNNGIGIVGRHEDDVDGNQYGIYLMDADPVYFNKASAVTQKYRFGDIGQSSQLVDTVVTFDSTSPVDSSASMFVRLDDVNYTSAISNDDCSTELVSRSKRFVNSVNFPIGNEWFFKLNSRDGAIFTEIKAVLSPRKTRHNNG